VRIETDSARDWHDDMNSSLQSWKEFKMSLFSNILSKLGFKSTAAQQSTTAPSAPSPQPATPGAPSAPPAAITEVDVVAKLEGLAASNTEKLNWKASIVDLLKLLGIDSSLQSRKALASELGCPAEKMADSAQMNMWLHKAVLRKLAENGGNVPKELLD
jgi:hypothetical protein